MLYAAWAGRLTAAATEVAWLVVDIHVATAARAKATSWDREPRPPRAQRGGTDVGKDRVYSNRHFGAILQDESLFVLHKIKWMRLEAGFRQWLAGGTKTIGVCGCNSVGAHSQRRGPPTHRSSAREGARQDLQPPPWLKRTCKEKASAMNGRTKYCWRAVRCHAHSMQLRRCPQPSTPFPSASQEGPCHACRGAHGLC